jgi:hypothetical protein
MVQLTVLVTPAPEGKKATTRVDPVREDFQF